MQGINPVLQLYHLIIRRRLLWVRPRVLLMELLVLELLTQVQVEEVLVMEVVMVQHLLEEVV